MSEIKNFVLRGARKNEESCEVSCEYTWKRYGKTVAILTCIVGAIYLAQGDHAGWGWLILLALILA